MSLWMRAPQNYIFLNQKSWYSPGLAIHTKIWIHMHTIAFVAFKWAWCELQIPIRAAKWAYSQKPVSYNLDNRTRNMGQGIQSVTYPTAQPLQFLWHIHQAETKRMIPSESPLSPEESALQVTHALWSRQTPTKQQDMKECHWTAGRCVRMHFYLLSQTGNSPIFF